MMDSQCELKITISFPSIGVTILDVADIKLYEVEISIHVSIPPVSILPLVMGVGGY